VDLGGLLTGDALISLVTLTAMEIVLGIDNVVFISILAEKLPAQQREKARIVGLSLAIMIMFATLGSTSFEGSGRSSGCSRAPMRPVGSASATEYFPLGARTSRRGPR